MRVSNDEVRQTPIQLPGGWPHSRPLPEGQIRCPHQRFVIDGKAMSVPKFLCHMIVDKGSF
jgi:hypothetical protein